jgi:hypothetical protein
MSQRVACDYVALHSSFVETDRGSLACYFRLTAALSISHSLSTLLCPISTTSDQRISVRVMRPTQRPIL